MGAIAAYGFARLRVVGRDYFMFYILVLRMVPPITAIVPLYFLFRVTELGGRYVAIISVYTAFNLPFAIWMLKSFIDELHQPIEEAARLDGSSHLKILLRICLPQMRAGLAATAIIAFVFTWNDFLFSLLLTSVDTRTVPVAMTRVVGRRRRRRLGRFRGNRHDLPACRSCSSHFFSAGSVAARRHLRHCAPLERLPEPNSRVAGREVIEPTEFQITVPVVEFRRLKRERVEIGAAAALLSRGRLRAGQQS